MTDPDTPKALRVIAAAMREPLYQTDTHGIEALVLDNAADEIENSQKVLRFATGYIFQDPLLVCWSEVEDFSVWQSTAASVKI